MLTEIGESCEIHDHHFKQDTPDEVWLTEVGNKGWVVFTKDKMIRKRVEEYLALTEANNAVFVFTGHGATGQETADAFKNALPAIKKLLAKQQRPFIAGVSKMGKLTLYTSK